MEQSWNAQKHPARTLMREKDRETLATKKKLVK